MFTAIAVGILLPWSVEKKKDIFFLHMVPNYHLAAGKNRALGFYIPTSAKNKNQPRLASGEK